MGGGCFSLLLQSYESIPDSLNKRLDQDDLSRFPFYGCDLDKTNDKQLVSFLFMSFKRIGVKYLF